MTQGEKCFLCKLLEDLEFEEHQETIKHLAATHDCTQSFKCENCANNNFHTDLAKSKNSNPIDQPLSEDKNLNKIFVEIKKTPKENKKPSQNSDDIVEFVEKIEAEIRRKFQDRKSKNNQEIAIVDLTLDVEKNLNQNPDPTTTNPENKTDSNIVSKKIISTPNSPKKSSRKQKFPSNDINSQKNQSDELTFEILKRKPDTETPIKMPAKKSRVIASKSVCPVCNKLIPDSLITVHANQCLEKPTLRKLSEKNHTPETIIVKSVKDLETNTLPLIEAIKSQERKCEKCNKTFSSKGNLKQHIKIVHEEQNNFESKEVNDISGKLESILQTCEICDKTFSSIENLKSHTICVHEGQKNSVSAGLKEKTTKTKSILKIKLEKHDEADKKAKQFNCHDCSKTFVSKQGLGLHITKVHKTSGHVCKFCDKSFSTKSNLNAHIKNLHKDIKIDSKSSTTPMKTITPSQNFFSCKFCAKKFSHSNYLNDHIRNKHDEIKNESNNKTQMAMKIVHEGINAEKNDKIIPKKHIGIRIKTVQEMNSKIIGHEGQNKSNFTNSNSNAENSLKNESILEVIKDQKCDLCSESFAQCHELKNHIKNAHGGQKKFKCPNCDNSYSTSQNLKNHMQIMHETTPAQTTFKCEICDKSYMFKSTLATHTSRIHQKGKKEKCEKCGSLFFEKYDLKRHIAKVHEKKKGIFECDYCGETFDRKTEQEVHLKEIHREVKIN